MVVATLLVSARQSDRVRSAVAAPNQIVSAASVPELFTILRDKAVDVLILDPVIGRANSTAAASGAEIQSVAAEFPYLPVVFYVSNPAKAVPVIALFPTRERCEALLAGVDDSAETIARAIEHVVGSSLVSKLVQNIGLDSDDVPPALQRAIRQVFSNPCLFRTATDMALAACMTRRTLDRWLARRRLVAASDVLHVARVFVAIRLERDHLLSRDEIYQASGLPAWRVSRTFIARATGAARDRLLTWSDEELISYVNARLRRSERVTDTELRDDPTVREFRER